MSLCDSVKFDDRGLVTAIAQDAHTGQVLMLAYMNRETLAETLESGVMVYWSRSRQKRWLKGETSGHVQHVVEAYIDCDGDALLFKIDQKGGACHKGYVSCFYRTRSGDDWQITGTPIKEEGQA
jgi:phosphoribosyl-AMP cyclohydrolase